MAEQSIFREQSQEKVASPEELDSYLKVTGPGVWFTLAAVVVLLAGVICWMIFGRLNIKQQVAVVVSEGQPVCFIPVSDGTVPDCDKVTIGKETYNLKNAGRATVMIPATMDTTVLKVGGLLPGMEAAMLDVDAKLNDGTYIGEIVVQTVKPITLIIN